MNKLGIIGGILVSMALLVSSTGGVLADSGEGTPTPEAVAQGEQQYQGIVGTVTQIDGDVVTLETKSLGEEEVTLTEDTIYKVPGQEEASKGDIEEGSRLAILVTVVDGDGYTAVRVMVVPEVATRQHINGVIVSVQDRVLTITNAAGDIITDIELPEGVEGGVVGDFVSVAVRKSSGGGNPEASGLQTAAEVQVRIQAHLNEVAGRRAQTQAEIQQREQIMTQLGEQLEGLALRHRAVLEGVLANAPVAAREAIQRAIGNAEQGIERARQAINDSNAAAGGQQSGKPTTAPGR